MNKKFILTVAICFTVLLLLWIGKSIQSSLPMQQSAIASFDSAKVNHLEVTVPGENTVVLEKEGQEWKITSPVQTTTQEGLVNEMLDHFEEVYEVGTISESLDARAQYGLGEEEVKHIVVKTDDTTVLDLQVGKTTPRNIQTYGVINEKAPVVLLQGDLGRFIPGGLQALRNKTIHEISGETVTQISLFNETGKVSIIKNPEGAWITSPDQEANQPMVEQLLQVVQVLQAASIIDEPTTIPTEVNAYTTLYVTTKDGGAYEYYFTEEDGTYIGANPEGSIVFTIPQYVYDRLMEDVAVFEGGEE